MNTRQSKQLDTLQSAKAFLQQNAAHMPTLVGSGMQQDFDATLSSLEAHTGGQASHRLVALGTTRRVMSLRESLVRDHMAHIARVAEAKLPNTPELVPLRLPQKRLTDRNLAAAAEAMATAAAPYNQVFLDAGLPQDVLAQLTAASNAMIASRELLKQTQGKRSGATKGLDEKLREGRRVLKALDAFVTTALVNDPALLENWKMLIRVRKVTGPRAASAGTTAGAATPVGAVSGAGAPAVSGAVTTGAAVTQGQVPSAA